MQPHYPPSDTGAPPRRHPVTGRPLTPLTPRQRDVLAFVVEHIERAGYPPTVREIARHFGFRSTRTAGEHLDKLAIKGALAITPGVARGIRVLRGREGVHGRVADEC